VRVEALAKATLTETRNAAADVAAMPAGAHPLMQQVAEAIEARAGALLSGLTDEVSGESLEAPAAKPQKPVSKPPRKNARARTT
jgi:serine/threonine-protein kinase HipA